MRSDVQIKFNWFYKKHTLSTVIDGRKFVVDYCRIPFWTNEKPSLKLFLKEKINTWYGSVWEVTPNGSRIAAGFHFGECYRAYFPKKFMRNLLERRAKHYVELTTEPYTEVVKR